MRRQTIFKTRRIVGIFFALGAAALLLVTSPKNWEYDLAGAGSMEGLGGTSSPADGGVLGDSSGGQQGEQARLASEVLETLEVKGRAPKTGYERAKFYNTWPTVDGCNLRQKIIKREFGDEAVLKGCDVISGTYYEPYTGKILEFKSKAEISKGVQIDHIVALSDAWQKGAQYKSSEERYAMATDPLNLIAVDASANQQKSDGDAATWLPANKAFRCQYVARQVSVKAKYGLWVTEAEKEAIARVLSVCPEQKVYGGV